MERIYEDVFQDAFDLEDHCRILAVPRSKGSLHITVSEAGNKEIDLEVMESTQLRLFIHNKADGKVVLHMKGKIMAGASARIALLDLEDQPFEFDQHIDLKEEGASIDNSTAQLVKSAFKKETSRSGMKKRTPAATCTTSPSCSTTPNTKWSPTAIY